MKIYRTRQCLVVENDGRYFQLKGHSIDDVAVQSEAHTYLRTAIGRAQEVSHRATEEALAPVGSQEIWAAGVTYYRSRNARMEESMQASGSGFYDAVYNAERPELFLKAMPHKVVGPRDTVNIRPDASWSVPEPELALLVSPRGSIVGYTISNDMTARDIEAENPLYLPQAKIYDRSCALGPAILIRKEPLPGDTEIILTITRSGGTAFSGKTLLSEMRRSPEDLVQYLFRSQVFSSGCFLLTGTGIIPPDSFALRAGDEIQIGIAGIGVLANRVR